jgi:hypothetical protein
LQCSNSTGSIADKNSITTSTEKIYVYKDIMALGTVNIMKYYMSLYKSYGNYNIHPENVKQKMHDIIFSKEEYSKLGYKASLKSDVQLFEHLHFFNTELIAIIRP